MVCVITHPCSNLNVDLIKPPLKYGYWWVITSYCFTQKELFVHAVISMLVHLISVSKKKNADDKWVADA